MRPGSSIARRIPALAVRCSRPASIGSPSGPVMIRATPAQAMRRAVSAVMGPAKALGETPLRAQRQQVDAHAQWGRSPRTQAACRRSAPAGTAPPARRPGAPHRSAGHRPAVAVHHRFQSGVTVSPLDRVQMPPQIDPPAAARSHPNQRGRPPASSSSPSGSTPATQRRTALPVSSGPRTGPASVSTRSVGRQVRPPRQLLRRGRPSPPARAPRSPLPRRRRHQFRQLFEPPPGPYVARGLVSGHPQVPRQPGLHRGHPVGAVGLSTLAHGHESQQRGQLDDPPWTIGSRRAVRPRRARLGRPATGRGQRAWSRRDRSSDTVPHRLDRPNRCAK